MKATISARYIPLLNAFSAKNDVRYYLNQSISIEPAKNGGVYLASTDGHRIVMIHDEDGETDEPMLVPPEMPLVREAKNASKAKFDGETCELFDELGLSMLRGPAKRVDGKFPDWRSILPDKNAKNWSTGTLNVRLLREIEKAPWEPKTPHGCTMYVRPDGAAVIRPLSLPEIYILLMPMATSYESVPKHVPEWLA